MQGKILIALSDASLAEHISVELAKLGYTSTLAKNGDEALSRMRQDMPDLVLIDLFLSGKNGYDVLTEKSLDKFITKIPAIIVSNSGSIVDIRRLPSTPNIKDYVIKVHVEPGEVIEKIKNALGANVSASRDQQKNKIMKKILWVEDDKFLGTILFKKFKASGYEIFQASQSEEAFKVLETQMPDIIILDVLLPGMNGFDILQKIRTNENMRQIPVIVLSNLSKQSDIERAKTLGAHKFLVKAAVSLDEIVKEVDAVVNQ